MKKKQKPAAFELFRPVDGKFLKNAAARAAWCNSNKHPLAVLNLSKSTPTEDHLRCLCGEREEVNPR